MTNKLYDNQIKESIRTGMSWIVLSASLIQLTLSTYYLVDKHVDFFSIANTAPITAYLLSLTIYVLSIKKDSILLTLIAFPLLTGCHWMLMALGVETSWSYTLASERILMFEFFVILMGLFYNLPSLLIALAPILGMKIYFGLFTGSQLYFDIFVSIIKYPLLTVFFITTLRAGFLDAIKARAEVERLNKELIESSSTDALTGIANRRKHNDALESAVNSARRFETPLSLLLIDVDFFKRFNDSLGHPAGDKCLIKLARVIGSVVKRSTDTFCRVGGEEFTIILPGSTPKEANQLAEKIHVELERSAIVHPHSSASRYVTVSIGLAHFKSGDSASLYKQADLALYKAKDDGRNRTATYSTALQPSKANTPNYSGNQVTS